MKCASRSAFSCDDSFIMSSRTCSRRWGSILLSGSKLLLPGTQILRSPLTISVALPICYLHCESYSRKLKKSNPRVRLSIRSKGAERESLRSSGITFSSSVSSSCTLVSRNPIISASATAPHEVRRTLFHDRLVRDKSSHLIELGLVLDLPCTRPEHLPPPIDVDKVVKREPLSFPLSIEHVAIPSTCAGGNPSHSQHLPHAGAYHLFPSPPSLSRPMEIMLIERKMLWNRCGIPATYLGLLQLRHNFEEERHLLLAQTLYYLVSLGKLAFQYAITRCGFD